MKKCTRANKGYKYYCFDEELSEELESLIALVEAFTNSKNTPTDWTITPIYEGRNKLFRLQKGQYDFVIKCFAIPNRVRQIYYGWGRNSKAKRSFQNSLYLEELELGVAKARAFVEEHTPFGLLKRSYYISDWVDYTRSHIHHEMRGLSNPNGFLPALAEFIVQLHEAGIEHRDLSPGNVLYKYNQQDKTYSFSLVDVNRMQTYPYALSPQLSLKNMERLASNYSVSSQLAYYYAKARGWETEETIKSLNKLCDSFWLGRMPKLTSRALKKYKGLSRLQIIKLYWHYKLIRLRRKLTSNKERKAKLFAQEEKLYRQFFSIEDIRHTLLKREGYSYDIEN